MFGLFKREDINKGIDEYQATRNAVLLDVRSKDEYRSGHVPGSENIDVDDIDEISSLVSDRATSLFVYCLSGARSGKAVSALKRMGYVNVKSIGGISSYKGPMEEGS